MYEWIGYVHDAALVVVAHLLAVIWVLVLKSWGQKHDLSLSNTLCVIVSVGGLGAVLSGGVTLRGDVVL